MTIHKKSRTTLIAHRGNSSQAPENSLAAFIEAIRIPVDYLECDVQLSKEGIPVVIHDGTFSRITNNLNLNNVNELTVKEIKEIDSGSWFGEKFFNQRIMTLEEFIQLPKGKVGVMLEVKEETFLERSMGMRIADVIKKNHDFIKNSGPLLVGSLNPNVLLCTAAYLPEQPLIPIVRDLNDLKEFSALRAHYYAFRYNLITAEIIEEYNGKGIQIWAWTVDDKDTAFNLMQMGVDGIISNHPKKMVSLCHPDRKAVGELAQRVFDKLLKAKPKECEHIFDILKNRINCNS